MPLLGVTATSGGLRGLCRWRARRSAATVFRTAAGKGFGGAPADKGSQGGASKRGPTAGQRGGGGGGGGGSQSQQGRRSAEALQTKQYENLMFAWDDMFESLSSTPSYAQRLLDLARSGFAQHGRGCVFVRASLNRRYSKQTVGGKAVTATCTTGEPLSADPELLLQSLATDYLPASLVAAGPVYDTPESLVPGLVDMGRTQQQSSATGVTDGASASSAAAGHDPAVEELQRAMRGMDTARLCTLMGGGSAGQDVGGEEPYDPASDEFVLLLSIKVDNAPVIGADVVRAVQAPDGSMRLINPQLDGLLGGAA